jgi:hypothetical protein
MPVSPDHPFHILAQIAYFWAYLEDGTIDKRYREHPWAAGTRDLPPADRLDSLRELWEKAVPATREFAESMPCNRVSEKALGLIASSGSLFATSREAIETGRSPLSHNLAVFGFACDLGSVARWTDPAWRSRPATPVWSKVMTKKQCAKLFGVGPRGVTGHLDRLGVRYELHGRQGLRVAAVQLPPS